MNFYFDAANVLDKLDTKQGSIKSLISTFSEKDRGRAAALVIETLKYRTVLSEVIATAELRKHERLRLSSQNLSLLLVHDLLLSKGIQARDGPIKQAVLRHKARLHAELAKIMVKRGASSFAELSQNGDFRADMIPRYVRINTLCWTTEQAIKHFMSNGFEQGNPLLDRKSFNVDEHIPNLLAFHPSTNFKDSKLLSSGQIILQDKASCFPAIVLAPPAHEHIHVIDATAAPGNKTTLLSALMHNMGKLFAFERDRQRFKTLQRMLAKARCQNVEARNEDFLSINPSAKEFSHVSHILLDPSCSGSGIVNRLDHLLGDDEKGVSDGNGRLQKLAAFQFIMIKHAMNFPSVEKIVYSTCSVHAEENENVVRQALASEEALIGNFVLAGREDVLPTWYRRGVSEQMGSYKEFADSLVRCNPGEDSTNGFFVSCFVRVALPTTGGKRRRNEGLGSEEESGGRKADEKIGGGEAKSFMRHSKAIKSAPDQSAGDRDIRDSASSWEKSLDRDRQTSSKVGKSRKARRKNGHKRQ